MSDHLDVRDLDESEHEDWNAFVAESSCGSVYHDTRYLDVLREATGARVRVRAAFKGSELAGGIPLFERRTLAGRYLSPRLLLYYNGFVLRDYESRYPARTVRRRLRALDALESSLRQEGYASMTVKSRPALQDARLFLQRGWSARPSYTYVVPIGDLEAAWSRMEQNLRRLVERSRAEGVTVTEDDDFDAFFRLHREVHERKGAPLYLEEEPYRRYVRRVLDEGLGRLFHARLPDGRSVSTQLVLTGDHPVSHTVCAAVAEDHQQTGATALLRWEAFRRLSEAGHTANDLTDAALNPVTRFKRQLGGDLEMALELHRTPSRLFRVEQGGRRGLRRARGLAGGGLRRAAALVGRNGR